MVFVWLTPSQWLPSEAEDAPTGFFFDNHHLHLLWNGLVGLIPFSWLILITRVVHDENPVGISPFWITRPYNWRKLFAAKSLFLVTFVLLPLFVEQLILLHRGGFNPRLYVGALLYGLVLFTSAILPMFALATIVSSLLRLILTLLAACGLLVAAAFVASSVDSPSTVVPTDDPFSTPILIALCAVIIIVQYSWRRLWLGRSIMIIMIATLGFTVSGPFDSYFIDRIYPLTAGPLHLSYVPASDRLLSVTPKTTKKLTLNIPVEVSGILDNGEAGPDNARITLTAADGSRWTSPWQAIYNVRLLASEPQTHISVDVDRVFFDRIRSHPFSLHMEVAFTELIASPPIQSALPAGEQLIPTLGICAGREPGLYKDVELFCRNPLHAPGLSRLTTAVFSDPCESIASVSQPIGLISAWTGVLEPSPANLDLSPLSTNSVVFQGTGIRPLEADRQLSVCAGAPMTITRYKLSRRTRYQLEATNLLVPETKLMLSR